jgi:hypothetical protein
MHVSEEQTTRHVGWRAAAERLSRQGAVPGLVVAIATSLGLALRLIVGADSVFADELSTYWIVSTNDFDGVVSTVHSDAEITPPLFFVTAWLSTQIDLTPELLRAPSLLAGVVTIPLTYLLGRRTVGPAAGMVGAALTALSPFLIYYSAEARGYAVMVALLLGSTLAFLRAVDDRRTGWWVVYAVCTAAAMYTHYTAVFALAVQLLWLWWAHPEARRAAIVATGGAVVLFLPWISGLQADFESPTTDILDAITPFDVDSVTTSLGHWAVGYPYVFTSTGLRALPGVAAILLLVGAVAIAIVGLVVSYRRGHPPSWLVRVEPGPVLIVALALSTPVGEIVVSAMGTNMFGTRNLAASWPAFALCLAALLVAAGPGLRVATVTLAIAAFGIGAGKMLEARFERPDYHAAAEFIDRDGSPGDVIIDGAGVTPGPLTGLEVALDRPRPTYRVGVPQQRDHPFSIGDPIFPIEDVTRRAAVAAGGHRLYIVSSDTPFAPSAPTQIPRAEQVIAALPSSYHPVAERTYPGSLRLVVSVYADDASPRR